MRNFIQVRLSSISLGMALAAAAVAIATTGAQAQPSPTIYSFCSSGSYGCPDGAYPYYGSLIQGSDGNFYGMTEAGGSGGGGTVFKITPDGALTTLYNFCSQPSCADGSAPFSGLIQGSDGSFYGTTSAGGVSCFGSTGGCGTVFKITPTGTLTTLYRFCPQTQTVCADGAVPYAGLVQGTDGNLYGTTLTGGTDSANPGTTGGGTIFKISPSGGTPTTLYPFCASSGCPDGSNPEGGLVEGSDGNFYGTTPGGGANNSGSVFKITPTGTLTTLHSFCTSLGCPDGVGPLFVTLIQASDGNFYGTTSQGGSPNIGGTVFRITPGGTLTPVYTFCPQTGCADGKNPVTGVIQASDGNLYGTTANGGSNGGDYGTVYKLTLDGVRTPVYDFCSQPGCTDGFGPYAPVVEGSDGNLYGTTHQTGGAQDQGTVYSLATGLNEPAVTLGATSINFGMFQVGGLYPIPQVKLTDSGNGPLSISSIQKTGTNPGDFSESDNCPISPNTLAAGAQCTLFPNFTPQHLGPLSAAISISDNAAGSPQTIALSGTAVDFSVSAVPLSNTIKGGKAASYTVSVAPLGGNTLMASLSVAGCPANTSCTLSPSQFALNGSTATKSMLTVKGNGKTPSGTYTLTISGKVFTVTHSTSVTLVVQ